MKDDKFVKVIEQTKGLMELHRKAQDTLRNMIFALVNEHLKQNGVGHTMYSFAEVKGALELWLGGEFKVAGRVYPRRQWPTHLRLPDFKPVNIGPPNDAAVRDIRAINGAMLCSLPDDEIELNYISIPTE